jgi:hypothetical protein
MRAIIHQGEKSRPTPLWGRHLLFPQNGVFGNFVCPGLHGGLLARLKPRPFKARPVCCRLLLLSGGEVREEGFGGFDQGGEAEVG